MMIASNNDDDLFKCDVREQYSKNSILWVLTALSYIDQIIIVENAHERIVTFMH